MLESALTRAVSGEELSKILLMLKFDTLECFVFIDVSLNIVGVIVGESNVCVEISEAAGAAGRKG